LIIGTMRPAQTAGQPLGHTGVGFRSAAKAPVELMQTADKAFASP